MLMRIDLKELLSEHGCIHPELVREEIISDCNLSFLQIRDRLYQLGTILYEDTENHIYVAAIGSGLGNMNQAIISMQLRSSKLIIAGYAKEGIIKQNILEKAFQKLTTAVQNKEVAIPTRPKKTSIFLLLILIVGFAASVAILFTTEVHKTINATAEYNVAAEQYNILAKQYNDAVALASIDNISGLPQQLDLLSIESTEFWDNVRVVVSENSPSKIAADTQTIKEMTEQITPAITVVSQITAPGGDWVTMRLSSIDGVTGTQAVTEELDPDKLLNKEGGFSACIYFTFDAINPEEVPGDTIVEKGTDAGGAIEVYPTLTDAIARCEYLAGFNGTVLYSGSYAIVGTMVIRTSYKLSNEQQFNLTNAITSALTALK